MMTGMISASFACAWVCALNCLTNSPMLTPCWPSAGPTGGAGLACPPVTSSFTTALSCFLAIAPSAPQRLEPLDLAVGELHRRGAPEDRHRHAQKPLGRVDLLDDP